MDATSLLAGPRGRRLCWHLLDPDPLDDDVPHLPLRGIPYDEARLARRVAALDLPAVVGERWRAALRESVWAARPWQEPDEIDQLLSRAAVAAELDPVAHAVVTDPAVAWWADPIAREMQVRVGSVVPDPGHDRGRVDLTAWRAGIDVDEQAAADPDADFDGAYWATPLEAHPIVTTRADPSPPPGLDLVEDAPGERVADVAAIAVADGARVYEIDSSDTWAELVRRYPLPVPYSRRQDWSRSVGFDGHWLMPDHLSASAEWDAIHLSVAAYLSTAGTAVPVTEGWAVLAGWNPDATWWLNDAVTVDTPTARWVSDGDEWTRQPSGG